MSTSVIFGGRGGGISLSESGMASMSTVIGSSPVCSSQLATKFNNHACTKLIIMIIQGGST